MIVKVVHIKNKLNEYLSDFNLKSPFKAIVQFGIPYVKIKDVQKSISASLIMLVHHTHTRW